MTTADRLNQLERYWFFQRTSGEASASGYIGSNTWKGFCSIPKIASAPSEALKNAFNMLAGSLKQFLGRTPNLTRQVFDVYHEKQVEELFDLLQTARAGVVVQARADGNFHERAYNSYAKVVNLAHSHWCFRPQPNGRIEKDPPASFPDLRRCL